MTNLVPRSPFVLQIEIGIAIWADRNGNEKYITISMMYKDTLMKYILLKTN